MKRLLLFTLIFAFLLSPTVEAAMTYGGTYYKNHISQARTGSSTDPIRLFMDEVEDLVAGGTYLQLTPTTEPTGSEGMFYYDDVANAIKLYTGAAWVTLGTTAAGTSLDGSYDLGSGITVDDGAVTLTTSAASDCAALAIAHGETGNYAGVTISNASAYPAVQFTTTGAGADITGTSDKWSISKVGVFSFANAETLDNATDDKFEFNSNDKEDFTLDLSGTNVIGFASDTEAITLEFNALDRLTGIEDITFDAEAANITLTADGSTEDLTISQAGAVDASLILTSAGTSTTDALIINTDTGSIDLNSADNLDIDVADNITVDTAGGAVTVTSVGGDITLDASDSSVIIRGTEAAADAVLIVADTAAGGIDISSQADIDITTVGAAGEDISITNTGGSVNISATEEDAAAVTISAGGTAGGITVGYGTGNMVITGTGASADFTLDADLISIDGTGTSNITFTNGAGEDVTISTAGAADHSLIFQATGTAADAMQIITTAGGLDITNNGAAGGEDIDVNSVSASVNIFANESAADSIVLSSRIGGIDILAEGAAAGEDIDIIATGSSVNITATEAAADAIKLSVATTVASASVIDIATTDGGITVAAGGASNGDVTITSGDDVIITATGAITVDTTVGGTYKGIWLPDSIVKKTITTGSLTSADCGYCLQVSADAQTITLPATVAGLTYWIMNIGADGDVEITIELDNADKFIGSGIAPADGEAIINTKATADCGDYIKVTSHTDGWIITEMNGTWAEATP